MKNNEQNREELNYKQAYHHLFNKVTEIIKALKTVQIKAEEICIGETIPDNIEIDTEEILRDIIDNLKENN